jgi:hypothetical protein
MTDMLSKDTQQEVEGPPELGFGTTGEAGAETPAQGHYLVRIGMG